MEVTVTFAQSLDGRIATLSGESRWISGNETLRLAHELRGSHDGVLVGVRTVIVDNPELTCRLPLRPSPLRIVLDSKLSIPLDSALVKTASRCKTLLLTTARAPQERIRPLLESGTEISVIDGDAGGPVDLRNALEGLEKKGVKKLLVEGGSAVITSFIRSGFVTRLVVVIAPLIIGNGTPSVGNLGVSRLSEARRLRTVRIKRMGKDVVWELEPDE